MSEIRLLQAIKKIKDKIEKLDSETIKKVYIDKKGHLIIELKNKEKIDLGIVKEKPLDVKPLIGKDGKDGKDGISIVSVEIKDHYLYVALSSGEIINAGYIGGSAGEEVDPIFTASPAYDITSEDINNWDNKSDFSGSYTDLTDKPTLFSGNYNDLTNKPTIPDELSDLQDDSTHRLVTDSEKETWGNKSDFSGSYNDLTDTPTIPTKLSELTNDDNYVQDANYVHTDNNFDSTAANKINSNAQNIANLTTNKEDKTNKVTSLSSSSTDTEYPSAKAVYDTINNKFFYISISSANVTTTKWSELYEAYSNDKIILAKIDYMQGITTVPVIEPLYLIIGNQSGGTFMFTFVMGSSSINYMITGTGDNVCTVTKQEKSFEETANKVQSVVSNKTSATYYPSTKAVYNEFTRKPVLIYDKVNKLHISGTITSGTDDANGLLNQNQGEGTTRTIQSWNITGMDLSEFKRIRVVYSRNDGTSAVTGEFFIPLDADYITDGDLNAYVNGTSLPYYAVRTRLVGMTAAVSSDKTKFCVTQAISLTATTLGMVATTVNDMYVTKIEGYYD